MTAEIFELEKSFLGPWSPASVLLIAHTSVLFVLAGASCLYSPNHSIRPCKHIRRNSVADLLGVFEVDHCYLMT